MARSYRTRTLGPSVYRRPAREAFRSRRPRSIPGLGAGGTATTELSGTRWFDDNSGATETTFTALAAQDVAIVGRPALDNTLIRAQIQTTGDLPSSSFTLLYRKVGDAESEWEEVL